MLQQKRMLTIYQGWMIGSFEIRVNGIQLPTVECCYTILNKLKEINYFFEITPDTQQVLLFGYDLYRNRLGSGFHRHILPVGSVPIKYPPHLIASNNSTPVPTTLCRIFHQFGAGVVGASLLLIHSQFVRDFSAAAPVH